MLPILLLLVSLVRAQYEVFADRSSYSNTDDLVINWAPNENTVIELKDLTLGEVLLCTCNSSDTFACHTLVDKLDVSAQRAISVPLSSLESSFVDGYYMIQFVTINPKNKREYALAYSRGWFTFSGMSGSGVAKQGCNIPSDTDENVPQTASHSTVTWSTYTVPSSLSKYLTTSEWLMPYSWQLGGTKFAPPQSVPGSKMTQTVTPSRRFPTSQWSTYTTYLMSQLPLTTQTVALSTATRYYNWASSVTTTPSGKAATRVTPSYSIAAEASTRKKRWAE